MDEGLNNIKNLMNEHFKKQSSHMLGIVDGTELTEEQEKIRNRALLIIKELESDEDLLGYFSKNIKLSKIYGWLK